MHAAAMIANDTLSGAPQSVKPKKPTTVKPKDANPKTKPTGKPPIKKQRKRKSETSAKALKEETEWYLSQSCTGRTTAYRAAAYRSSLVSDDSGSEDENNEDGTNEEEGGGGGKQGEMMKVRAMGRKTNHWSNHGDGTHSQSSHCIVH
jgi:hypothetical protein